MLDIWQIKQTYTNKSYVCFFMYTSNTKYLCVLVTVYLAYFTCIYVPVSETSVRSGQPFR